MKNKNKLRSWKLVFQEMSLLQGRLGKYLKNVKIRIRLLVIVSLENPGRFISNRLHPQHSQHAVGITEWDSIVLKVWSGGFIHFHPLPLPAFPPCSKYNRMTFHGMEIRSGVNFYFQLSPFTAFPPCS